MNELERYKAIAKAAEVYRNKYMTLSENLAKSLIQASKATFMKEAASLKVDTAWVSLLIMWVGPCQVADITKEALIICPN